VIDQLTLGKDLLWMGQKEAKEPVLRNREGDFPAVVVPQEAFLHLPGAKAKFPGLPPSSAGQHRIHAGQQLFLVEGLAKVVIGAGPEPIYTLVPAISRR
jgi:hypothetical protein